MDDPINNLDPSLALAHIAAYCDMLSNLTLELRAAIRVLELKGLLSQSEVQQCINSVPPAEQAQLSGAMQETLRARILEWHKEFQRMQKQEPY